jgi:iron complex outermembrane receptor protein
MTRENKKSPARWSRPPHFLVLMGAALVAMLLLDVPVRAQVEEIIVTARKREESLQKTPVSITAFTAAQLEKPGLDNLSDVTRFAPNVIFDRGTGNTGGSFNSQLFIRGVGQVDFLFSSDPGVGIYVDEVYLPRVVGSIMDVMDIERIEVLRGPQGTLYGKNTIGGALNITSQHPGDKFAAVADLTLGSRSRVDGKLSLDLPMIKDVLSARLTLSSRNQDGYVKRVNQPGRATGDTNSDGARGLLHWTPGNGWNVLLEADYNRRREEAIANELLDVRTSDPVLQLWNFLVAPTYGPGAVYDGRFITNGGDSQATGPSLSGLDMWGTSINVSKELSASTRIKSITAYRDEKAQFGQDQDHSPYRYLETVNHNKHRALSEELQIIGSNFNSRLDWVAGAFYMNEKASDQFDVVLGGGLYDSLEALPAAILPLVPGVTCPPPPGVVAPCAGGVGNPFNVALDFDLTIFDHIDIDSYAGYAQGTFKFTDKLSTTVGGRYTSERKKFTTMLVRNASGVTTVPEHSVSDSWSAFTPRIGFEYQWTPDLMTYISGSRGFKSGGFNGRAQSLAEIASFDPEYVKSYEIGVKSQWFDRHLLLNLSAFYNDYTDIQLTSVRAVQGLIVVVTENAGQARMQGLELEMVAQPAKPLLIRAGLGYLDAKYTELASGATVTLDNKLVKTPKLTGNLVADYEMPLGAAGTLTLGGDVSYRGSYFNDPNNTPLLEQGGYTLLGAHLRYQSSSKRWEFTAFGTNLSDKRYMTNGLQSYGSFGTADGSFGPPVEWGLTARARY